MKKLLALSLVAIVGIVGWRMRAPHETQDLAADRLWIDHIPRGERDIVNLFVLLDHEAIGVFQKMSAWTGAYEGFRYEANGGQLRIVYPQTGDREKIRVRASACKEEGMDYCLEIQGASRGVKRYYSRKGWEIDSREAAEKRVDELASALSATSMR